MSDFSQGSGWWQASDGKWYPPQSPPGGPPSRYRPPPSLVAPPRQGMGGCLKAFLIVAGIAGVLVILGAVLAVVGLVAVSHAARNATARSGAPAGYRGPAYPGMENLDHVADNNGRVEDFGFTVTATNFRRSVGIGRSVCADVTDLNRSAGGTAGVQNHGLLDWRLQQPNGVVEDIGINSTLRGGQLLQGASAAGTVCFDDSGQSGQFILIWRPITFSALIRGDRGIWLFNVQ
jgi:hypothetical protein